MKIKVKQEHIDKGLPGRANLCPIALALIDAGIPSPSVIRYAFRLNPWPSQLYSLPREAERFIRLFDARLPIEPFDFEIELPFRYQVRCALKSIARLVDSALRGISPR